MMEVVGQRTSIRSYKADAVSRETLLKVLECAGRAPSWGNKQCWKFVVVDSGLVMENLVLAAAAKGLSTCIVGFYSPGLGE